MAPFQVVVMPELTVNDPAAVSVVVLAEVREAVVVKVAAPMVTGPAASPKFASLLIERNPPAIVVPPV